MAYTFSSPISLPLYPGTLSLHLVSTVCLCMSVVWQLFPVTGFPMWPQASFLALPLQAFRIRSNCLKGSIVVRKHLLFSWSDVHMCSCWNNKDWISFVDSHKGNSEPTVALEFHHKQSTPFQDLQCDSRITNAIWEPYYLNALATTCSSLWQDTSTHIPTCFKSCFVM